MENLLTQKAKVLSCSKAFLRFKKARAEAKGERLNNIRVKRSDKIDSLALIVEKYINKKKIIFLWIKSMKWKSEISLEKTLLITRSLLRSLKY